MKNTLLSFCLLIAIGATAQVNRQPVTNYNAWLMYFGTHKFANRWGVHLEAQWRRSDWAASPQQLLLRTGINYHISPQATATAGYAFIETYPYGDYPARSTYPEHRLWEQMQFRNQVGWFEMINRFRLEQRWMHLPVQAANGRYAPGDAVYQNRFRVFNRFSIPFKGNEIIDHSWYATAYHELMLNFGRTVGFNVFDQNRAYLAIGYKLPLLGRLEVGYLHQHILKGDGIKVENNHTLQIGLSSTIEFRRRDVRP